MRYRLFTLSLLRRAVKLLGLLLSIVLIVIILTCTLTMGSQAGRLWLAQTVTNSLNASGNIHIALDGLSTPHLGLWHVKKVIIKRDKHLWMDIRNIKLQWQPGALLNQTLIIETFSANTFSYYHLPATTQNDDKQVPASNKSTLTLPAFVLEHLAIHTVRVHDAATISTDNSLPDYTITGNAKWLKNSPLFFNIDAHTLNGTPARLNISSRSDNRHRVTMKGSLQEDAGGVIGQLLQLPQQQKIAAHFDLLMSINEHLISINVAKFDFPLAQRDIGLTSTFSLATTTWDVYLDDLTVVIDDTSHEISGRWIDRQLNINVNLNQFPVDMINPWVTQLQSADLTTQLTIQGAITHPTAQGKITVNTVYNNVPIAIDFTGSASKEKILFEHFSADIADANITVRGNLDIVGESSDLSVQAKNLDQETLSQFNLQFPQPLQATRFSGVAKLHGSIQQPQGHITFTTKGNYRQQAFALTGDVTKVLDTITINSASATMMGGSAHISGNIQADFQKGDLDITANTIPLTALELFGVSLPEDLTATLNTQLTVSGEWLKPHIKVTATVDGHYKDSPFNIDVNGNYQNNNIHVKNMALQAFDKNILTVTGDYRPQHIDLHIKTEQLQFPLELFDAIGWPYQQGYFDTDLHAAGSLEMPQVNGYLHYKTVVTDVDAEREQIALLWQLKVSTQEHMLNLTTTLKRNGNNSGELLLNIPLHRYIKYFLSNQTQPEHQNIPLQATVNGAFDLQTLSFFLDSDLHRLTGAVTTHFTLNGTLGTPDANGSLTIDNAQYENTLTGTALYDINCTITAQQVTLNIATCQASDGQSGSYKVNGNVQLPINNSAGQIALNLQTHNANILQRPDIEGEATGKFTLNGDFNTLLASSELEISPLTALLNSTSGHGIPRIDVEEIHAKKTLHNTTAPKTFELPLITLDLLVSANQQAYLRGHGLEAELQGQIRVKGHLDKPHYEGEFQTVRGVFEIFGKKFKLEQGQVSFTNNAIAISLPGTYQKNGQQIKAQIIGSNEDFSLSLSAIPTMPEDEILAFIIFGKVLQKITPFEAIQLATAVQTLRNGGGGFFDPIGSTREILGVDTLSIEAEKSDSGNSGVNVGIGKYINEKVYLELKRTPNPSQPWKGKFEIELTPNLNLESATGGNTGIEGAEIKWKRDY